MAEQLSMIEQRTQVAPVTPMRLIEMAAERGASIEQMQQLFELKMRVEADEARKAYDQAISDFKAQMPRITKNVEITAGPLAGKKYADLFAVVDAITPKLSSNGLSASWKITKDEPQWLEVTCSIRHKQGHSESVSMGGPPDAGGAKNAIQARASTVSYLERYTLLAAIGAAAAGMDDDAGTVEGSPAMPEPEYVAWLEDIKGANTPVELKGIFANAYRAAEKAGDKEAMANFIKAKDEKKRVLA